MRALCLERRFDGGGRGGGGRPLPWRGSPSHGGRAGAGAGAAPPPPQAERSPAPSWGERAPPSGRVRGWALRPLRRRQVSQQVSLHPPFFFTRHTFHFFLQITDILNHRHFKSPTYCSSDASPHSGAQFVELPPLGLRRSWRDPVPTRMGSQKKT